MKTDIYKKLAQHLDNLPGGFPPSESGVELRLLKQLFTPEEAEFAVFLTLIPEEPKVIAYRAKISVKECGQRLESMAKKGLILRIVYPGNQPRYMAAQYVIGIWEFHVNSLTPELIKDMNEYIPTLFHEAWKKPQLRTIPVTRSITPQLEIMTYEIAEELVRSKKKAVAAPCICRRERKMMGESCNKPEEYCLAFGMAADYYEHNGLGRVIEIPEVLDILKKADKAGLVLQPGIAQNIANICCCCGCCCGILRTLKQFPEPASLVSSPFIAKTKAEICTGCGVCETRCQMDALHLIDDKVSLDAKRCIGCGLCVSTCPSGALFLARKPESEQSAIPKDKIEAAIALGRARGKLKTGELIMMQVKSKVDRLLTITR